MLWIRFKNGTYNQIDMEVEEFETHFHSDEYDGCDYSMLQLLLPMELWSEWTHCFYVYETKN